MGDNQPLEVSIVIPCLNEAEGPKARNGVTGDEDFIHRPGLTTRNRNILEVIRRPRN